MYIALARYLADNSTRLDAYKDGSTLSIVTFYSQTLALLASRQFYGIYTLINLDINSFGSSDNKRCITSLPPLVASCTGMVFVPAFICLVAWARSKHGAIEPQFEDVSDADESAIVGAASPRPIGSMSIRYRRAVLETLLFGYFGMTKKALELLTCTTVDRATGKKLVTIDKAYDCHGTYHMAAMCLAAVVLVTITIGIPCTILLKARECVKRPESLAQTTFIRTINLFDERYNWWMAWLLLRRALLAAAFVYGQSASDVSGDIIGWRAWAFILLIGCAMMQNWCQPFLLPVDNRLEQTSIQMLIFALYIDTADTSLNNRFARFGVLASITMVVCTLIAGDAPIVQKAKSIVRNPRQSVSTLVVTTRESWWKVLAKCNCCPCCRRAQISTSLSSQLWVRAQESTSSDAPIATNVSVELNPVAQLSESGSTI
jgi:hypothetical protein